MCEYMCTCRQTHEGLFHYGNYMCVYVYVSCKNTFSVKKTLPSKAELYLKVNARRDWQQQDLISECGQGLAY